MRARRIMLRAVVVTALIVLGVSLRRVSRPLGEVSALPAGLQHAFVRASVTTTAWISAVTSTIRTPGMHTAFEDELRATRTRVAALEVTLAEFRALAALERERPSDARLGRPITARVLAATFTPDAQALTLDHGTRDDVALGDPVIAHGSLLGTIDAVGSHRAVVRLLAAPGSRVSARRTTAAGAIGIVELHVGGGIVLAKIPNDREVRTGDAIVTDVTNIGIPAGIPIGILAEVRPDVDGFFRTAVITPGADPRRVLAVDILRQRPPDAAAG